MWEDWVKFQAQAARRRREQKEAEARRIALRKKRAEQLVEYMALGVATVVLAVMLVYGILLYMKHLR
jgi:cell division protein FtsL